MKPAGRAGRRSEAMAPNFSAILPLLVRSEVRFIVIGGGAAHRAWVGPLDV